DLGGGSNDPFGGRVDVVGDRVALHHHGPPAGRLPLQRDGGHPLGGPTQVAGEDGVGGGRPGTGREIEPSIQRDRGVPDTGDVHHVVVGECRHVRRRANRREFGGLKL